VMEYWSIGMSSKNAWQSTEQLLRWQGQATRAKMRGGLGGVGGLALFLGKLCGFSDRHQTAKWRDRIRNENLEIENKNTKHAMNSY